MKGIEWSLQNLPALPEDFQNSLYFGCEGTEYGHLHSLHMNKTHIYSQRKGIWKNQFN